MLSIDDELNRMGGGSGYYLVKKPKDVEVIKIKTACTMSVVVVPYVTSCSPVREPGQLYFTRDYYAYRNLGVEGKDRYFDCVRTFREKCPIGDYIRANNIPNMKSQRLGLMNLYVIERDGQPVNKLMLMDFSYANFTEQLITVAANKAKFPKYAFTKVFMDPKKGSVIDIAFEEGSYQGRSFYKATSFDFTPHNGFDGKMPELIKQAVDLDAALNKLSYEEAAEKFLIGAAPAAPPAKEPEAPAKGGDPDLVEAAKAAATSGAAFDDEGWN